MAKKQSTQESNFLVEVPKTKKKKSQPVRKYKKAPDTLGVRG